MAREKKLGPKLPVQQLAILSTVRVAEPLALTSVFPYLPEMIKSFGVPQDEVAKWAGMTSAVFSVCQSITAVPWGWASDTIGRKPTIIMGLMCTMTCFLFWGTSTSLAMAITVRGIQGASNGNVGTIRTMVAEMVPEKSLQPRAFSVMPMVWSVGSVFGPSFGGFFARPAEQFPAIFGGSVLFTKFPFLLPNLIALVFFVCSVLSALLFLEETLETQKYKRDWGIELGERILRLFRGGKPSKRSIIRARNRARFHTRAERTRRHSFIDDEATAPLLAAEATEHITSATVGDDSNQLIKAATPATPAAATPPEHISMFTYQTSMALLCYTMLALHSVAYDQILPVFLNYPHERHDSTNTQLPFKFSGGFGLSSGRIGTLFTINALLSSFAQFALFPPICSRYGPLRCFQFSCMVLPFVYLFTPYSVLIENGTLRYAMFISTFVIKGMLSNATFPSITIILTNSAPSVKVLGTLNGYATLVSGLGRAVGPALTGASFTWGVQNGYIISGWAFLSAVATIGAVSTLFLQEGDGLDVKKPAADDDSNEQDGDEELAEEDFYTESGAGFSTSTTDGDDNDNDNDDDEFGDYEESLLRDVHDDDDDYYISGVSSQPHAKSHAKAHWTAVAPEAPLPNTSLFTSVAGGATNASLLDDDIPSSAQPTKPQAPAGLREPEDPGSEDSDVTVSAATVAASTAGDADSAPTSPARTRRFRSASSASERGAEEARAATGSASVVPLSPVAPVAPSKD
ncbi:major facilitator superfamily transporter [Ophiostoma piceae UAMH 11346]|uniref:Major facilitator superfamily transporter n=1 Tax=Ophiostoma piceae (strain UAMH 11346) TaxID=1262450 RepID=S3BNL1_OPHP1|nr:major facilitator superfamily transporter [Ophiostoma piceae UAMH 11346]